jgi:hypothetical protein
MTILIIVGSLLLIGTLIADNIRVPTDTMGDGFGPDEMRMLSYRELRKERRKDVHN